MIHRIIACAFTLAVTGCNFPTGDCADSLGVHYSPQDTTIGPGEHYTAHLDLYGCAGQKHLDDTITFVSSDVGVATADSAGLVTGVRSGTATITVSAAYYHVTVPLTVHVR